MNTLTNLIKDRQIGTWCKRAAWLILVIGLAYIGFYAYFVSQQYNYAGRPLTLLSLSVVITSSLAILPHILFYFFILYAAGALVNHFVADEEEVNEEDDDEEDDTLIDEEVTPGQVL